MPDSPETNGQNGQAWIPWSKFVLKELERLGSCAETVEMTLNEMKTEIALLQLKSGIWGAAAGVITTVGVIIIALLTKIIK